MFKTSFLFASLFWGSVAVAYLVYGRRQQSFVAFMAGVFMMVVSFFISSALLMSLICVVLIIAAYVLIKEGY